MAGACIIASLHLMTPGFHDIASLDCELFKLTSLRDADAAPWDDLATACVSPDTLLSSDECPRVPLVFAGTDAYPLYKLTDGVDFFARQTGVQSTDCGRWFAEPSVEGQCTCDDITALKTIGSPARTRMLQVHTNRARAADGVRARRTGAILILERAIATVLTIAPAASKHARSVYDASLVINTGDVSGRNSADESADFSV